MTREKFEEIINLNHNFSYIEDQDLYLCNNEINITLKIFDNDEWDYNKHNYWDDPAKSKFCTLKYYYNTTLISEKYCISGRIFNKFLYLPVSHYYDVNGKLSDSLNNDIYFHFYESEILFLNKLLLNADKINILLDTLRSNPCVKMFK